ncbi:MAG: DUF3416 domain-containing protein [Desulfuromonadaceae bacterium]|nr:DUF3416 domain-containing protein [Desulfuromonadaceae bacterium]MDD5105393.1 DUF3416 domain-containing protein [Desulfuromonadaceae bacterium]
MTDSALQVRNGRMRAVIENVTPSVDGGRFAAKRILGDQIVVEADCFNDGHDMLACLLLWRNEDEIAWHEEEMAPHGLSDLIARVNRARHDNPALQSDHSLRFCPIDNDSLLCYTKSDTISGNLVVIVVNLDPHHVQSGWIELDLDALGSDTKTPYQMHDLLSDARFLWSGPRNFVQLDPQRAPAHIFAVRRKVRTEHNFDYFL